MSFFVCADKQNKQSNSRRGGFILPMGRFIGQSSRLTAIVIVKLIYGLADKSAHGQDKSAPTFYFDSFVNAHNQPQRIKR
jgi:hypothetical protein